MESLLYSIINEVKENMDGLSLVDEDYGQLENLDNDSQDMYPITFPCVLIDAPQVNWSEIEGTNQKGQAQVRTKLCIDCYDDTHYGSDTMEAIETRQEMVESLHHILQGFRPEGDAPLIRTASSFYTANHGIKVYEATYTVTVTDYVAPQTTTKPTVGIVVKRFS